MRDGVHGNDYGPSVSNAPWWIIWYMCTGSGNMCMFCGRPLYNARAAASHSLKSPLIVWMWGYVYASVCNRQMWAPTSAKCKLTLCGRRRVAAQSATSLIDNWVFGPLLGALTHKHTHNTVRANWAHLSSHLGARVTETRHAMCVGVCVCVSPWVICVGIVWWFVVFRCTALRGDAERCENSLCSRDFLCCVVLVFIENNSRRRIVCAYTHTHTHT